MIVGVSRKPFLAIVAATASGGLVVAATNVDGLRAFGLGSADDTGLSVDAAGGFAGVAQQDATRGAGAATGAAAIGAANALARAVAIQTGGAIAVRLALNDWGYRWDRGYRIGRRRRRLYHGTV